MAEITRLFHGSQIVEDVLEVGRLYHDFFGSWVYEAQHLKAEGCVNSANLMGGTFSMEMLAPLDREADSAEARFLRRHGPHFNNIAFWVRDCRGLVERLLASGVRVALRGHGVVDRIGDETFDYAITHPKDTCGSVLELLEDRPIHDPRSMRWWSDAFWRDRHPLRVEGSRTPPSPCATSRAPRASTPMCSAVRGSTSNATRSAARTATSSPWATP